MTPEELAALHPRLYHVTEPGSWESMKTNGLLCTSELLELFEYDRSKRDVIVTRRRSATVRIEHPEHGWALINDNLPISEKALESCLDDGLKPKDWMKMLNSRVFFWPSKERLDGFLNAKYNKNRTREVIVINTLSLAKAHADYLELSPINSGFSMRRAARRGLETFSPLSKYSYQEWTKLRGQKDQIMEIAVQQHVKDIAAHVVEVYHVPPKA